jgi:hypothetical protein
MESKGGEMTALCAILAIICIGGILMGAYLIGFDDGVKAEKMRRNLYIITLYEEKRHAITHADMVQMEAEAENKDDAQ